MIESATISTITGVMFNYYLLCHTKLWLFSHNIQMEQESDVVALGKLTHEEHYSRDASKEAFTLAGIKLDRITPDGAIHEIKKSDAGQVAHIWQLKYYLWVLKENGFGHLQGVLEFPKQRKRLEIELTEKDGQEILLKLDDIQKITSKSKPPAAKKNSLCRRCSYREFCWC